MPPRPQTKRARLPAFSTGQDGAEKLADWRLGGKSVWPLAGQANSSLLPSLLSLPGQKPEDRGPRAPYEPRPRQFRFASFGVCHEGCFRLPATRAVIYSAAKTAPAPADAGPPVLASAKYNCVLWPDRLACLSRSLLCGRLPRPWPPAGPAVRAPVAPVSYTHLTLPTICSV